MADNLNGALDLTIAVYVSTTRMDPRSTLRRLLSKESDQPRQALTGRIEAESGGGGDVISAGAP